MRISDILTEGKKTKNKRRVFTIGLLITGLMSLMLVIVTVYGQYAGTYLINMTRDASNKGIKLFEQYETLHDNNLGMTTLNFNALNDIEDTTESFVIRELENAINTDGLYYKEGQDFLAYTFYLKNTGNETVDIEYVISLANETRNLGDATMFKVVEHVIKDDKPIFYSDKNFSKAFTNKNVIAQEKISDFKPNDVRKITFLVWLEGELSTTDMLGGSVKFNWSFGILNAEGDRNE